MSIVAAPDTRGMMSRGLPLAMESAAIFEALHAIGMKLIREKQRPAVTEDRYTMARMYYAAASVAAVSDVFGGRADSQSCAQVASTRKASALQYVVEYCDKICEVVPPESTLYRSAQQLKSETLQKAGQREAYQKKGMPSRFVDDVKELFA